MASKAFWTMVLAGVAAMALWALIQYGVARYTTKPTPKTNGTKA